MEISAMAADIPEEERSPLQGKKSKLKEMKHNKSRLIPLKFWKKRKPTEGGGQLEDDDPMEGKRSRIHKSDSNDKVNLISTDQQEDINLDSDDRNKVHRRRHRRHGIWKRKSSSSSNNNPTSSKQIEKPSKLRNHNGKSVIQTSPSKSLQSDLHRGNDITDKEETTNAEAKKSSNRTTQIVPLSTQPLILVLILMDPQTRRFELLKLEFESPDRTTIQDVVSQIPYAASDEILRNQTYVGIGDLTGQELYRSTRLVDLTKATKSNNKKSAPVVGEEAIIRKFDNNDDDDVDDSKLNLLLLGLPSGMDPYECAQSTLPIIQDEQVQQMVSCPKALV
jgi:hypothetical protein